MSAPPAMVQMPDVAPAAAGETAKPPHVTIRGLSKRFDKTVIYDNFDLDIPRGELISVFGPNGCGKSTLINMIAGLVPADEGQILFDGRSSPPSISAMCSRIIARRCFPGCAPSTTSPIRLN